MKREQYKHAVHTWMFGQLPLSEIFSALHEIGFYADLSMTIAGESSPEHVMEFWQKNHNSKNIEVPVCTAMFMGEELNLSDHDAVIRKRAVAFAERCVEATACVGADRLLVSPSGITTAYRYSCSREIDWKTAVESLQEIGIFAQKYGVSLMIEPINRYRVALVHTVGEALSMARETQLQNIGIVPDVFHMCMEETTGVVDAIRAAGKKLLCLHIGGSTRNVPGKDRLDWQPILQALKEIQYDGVLSYEPVKLYFSEEQMEQDRTYRHTFLQELQSGKLYLERLGRYI